MATRKRDSYSNCTHVQVNKQAVVADFEYTFSKYKEMKRDFTITGHRDEKFKN